MSGTSLDGVDAALVEFQGSGIGQSVKLIDFYTHDIKPQLKDRILALMDPKTSDIIELTSLNVELGYLFAEAVQGLLNQSNFNEKLDFIASHGQTIYHLPKPGKNQMRSTLQIGDPSPIAYRFKVPVVFNFRMMDIAAGGEGAPLVPYTEYILFHNSSKSRLLQNIGGIGNVTILDKQGKLEDVWAFDTGPGNMMINAATKYYYNKAYDKDSFYASQGKKNEELFNELCNDEYLDLVPPKSTGREYYPEDFVKSICQRYENANDVIHTLTLFSAYTIAKAYKDFIFPHHQIDEIIVSGGGAYNPLLMQYISELLPEHKIIKQEDIGLSSDAKEAIAFALLGKDTLENTANNAPKATGANKSVILGQIQPSPFK